MGWSLVLAAWAVAVLIVSVLSATGRIKTVTINGMRRRRPGESEQAWQAGLRAYYPWVISSAVTLLAFALLLWFSPRDFEYSLVAAAIILVLAQTWPLGIWSLNREVRFVMQTELSKDQSPIV